MNRISILFIIFASIWLLTTCCQKKLVHEDVINKDPNPLTHNILGQERLPEIYYLKNRMDNCEDKIKYMQSIIEFPPDTKRSKTFMTKKDLGVMGSYTSYVKGFNKRNHLKDLKHFYFDLDCFEGKHYSALLPILLPPDQYKEVDTFLKSNPDYEYYRFEGLIYGHFCFAFGIKNNSTVNVNPCVSIINH